jgi:hypothetical protein
MHFLFSSLKTLLILNKKINIDPKSHQNFCHSFLLCHWSIYVFASVPLDVFFQCIPHSRLWNYFEDLRAKIAAVDL